MGPVNMSGLGDGFKTLRVGSVGTPFGTFTMSAAYRTTDNLHLSTQQMYGCLFGCGCMLPSTLASVVMPKI